MSPRALRALFLEALRGLDPTVIEALGPLASWRAFALLWEAGWLGGPRGAGGAHLRARLRALAAARISLAELARRRAGAPVLVAGRVREVRTVELLVADDTAEAVLVTAEARGLGRRAPRPGDGLVALGFAAGRIDPSVSAPGPRRAPTRAVIRSAGLPVIAILETESASR